MGVASRRTRNRAEGHLHALAGAMDDVTIEPVEAAEPNREVLALVGFAADLGVAPDALLRAAGFDPSLVTRALVPHRHVLRLWEEATRLSGDEDFGLHMASWMIAHAEDRFDVMAFAMRSCATLGDQYARMGRYIRLLHKETQLTLEHAGEVARLVHGVEDHHRALRQPSEAMLALMLLQGRRSIGEDFVPREVRFVHPAPARTAEHERVFRAPLRFGCSRDELVLDRALLDRPQVHAEPRLLTLLERQLEALLRDVGRGQSVTGPIRRCVADGLLEGEPTLATVARRLGLSARTLQRRLRDEGTSFADLIADVRHELALQHLRNPEVSIQEAAFLLGYSDVSTFHRAFKRRAGMTPATYRRAGQRATTP